MDRQQILAMFEVDEIGIIRSPGPFFGQNFYIPYFWYLHISGYREDVHEGVVTFRVRSEDRVQFPELANREIVRLRQQEDDTIIEL
jgi:hypothetical protein